MKQNYLKKLFREMDSKKINIRKGTVNCLEVAHDDWCPYLKGAGSCSCNPDLKIKVVQ